MRTFVALLPSDEAVEHLDAFLDVRRAAGDFRWTATDHLHVTLAFSENLPERVLDEAAERLEQAAVKRSVFTTRITGGGAFPDAGVARVIWAGLSLDDEGRDELARLASGARAALSKAGAPVDGARFRPHVTVARTKRPHDVSDWVRLLDAYSGPVWTAGEIALIASHLGEGPRRRPRHEVLARYPLRVEHSS